MKPCIAILMGGYSAEHDISINSGNVVYKYLQQSVYEPYRIVVTRDAWYYLDTNNEQHAFDKGLFSLSLKEKQVTFVAVFNTIHGTPGEDGLMQAYLNVLQIPQTSCGFYQAALTFNKRDCISVLKPYQIPTASNVFLNQGDHIDVAAIGTKVGFPCFVKANRSGSSYGVYKVYKEAELESAIYKAYETDSELIIESFLEGTEVSIGVCSFKGKVTVFPATEIVSENDFFDYEAKYQGKSQEITPARISPTQQEELESLAAKIYKVLNMSGLSRIDFIFHQGKPHFVEINTNPGLSEASIIPQQAKAMGISLTDLFVDLLDSAVSNTTSNK